MKTSKPREVRFPSGAKFVQTRSLLGGAYIGSRSDLKAKLTHLTFIEENGTSEVSFGCRGPLIEHATDIYGHSIEALNAKPTCPKCLVIWERLTDDQKKASAEAISAQFKE